MTIMRTEAVADSDATSTTPSSRNAPKRGRNAFLDAIRGIAVVRVVLWHTFGIPLISWTVASMPAMFFVAGSLLAGPLDRGNLGQLLGQRVRRLLLPFWVFGGVVLTALTVIHQFDQTARTAIPVSSLLSWLVPLVDPSASAWESGWLVTPLWYLRCYLWLLLVSPLLRKAYRRFGPALIAVPALAVLLIDWAIRHPQSMPEPMFSARWYLGDLITYSVFLLAGFAHHDGLIAGLSRRARLEWTAIFGATALLWIGFVDVPERIVNNSYVLLLFVGAAWLALFLAAESWIGSLTSKPVAGPILRWLGCRSMTVYLWHSTAIVAAFWLRSHVAPESPRVAVIPIVAIGTVVLSIVFGSVEDIAARRTPQWWPGSSFPGIVERRASGRTPLLAGLAVGATIGVVTLGAISQTGASVARNDRTVGPAGVLGLPPVPSKKPDMANFSAVAATVPPVSPRSSTEAPADGSSVRTEQPLASTHSQPSRGTTQNIRYAIEGWTQQKSVDGAVVAISYPDARFVVESTGSNADGSPLEANKPVAVTSVTKSFTAALILQLVDEGLIKLDDPLPRLDAMPEFAFTGKVTIRQLLMHTSGIPGYSDVPAYAAAGEMPITPEKALEMSGSVPLEWEPGTRSGYSSTGYLTLGLLAEQLTGKRYEALLKERFFSPLGLASTRLDAQPRKGWIGYSAGGIESTPADLVRWGAALYRDGKVLSPASLRAMTDVDNEFSAGLGAFPVCPCSTGPDGVKLYTSIGHHGGQVSLQYSPSDNLVIAVSLTESMWTDALSQSDVAELMAATRDAAPR